MLLKRIIEEYNLYEGLEVTHPVDEAVNTLNTWWNLDGKVHFRPEGVEIEMEILNLITSKDFDSIIQWANNFGYFPASQSIGYKQSKFDYENVIHALHNSDKHTFYIKIFFDPKYDPEIPEEGLPEKGYHVAPTKSEEKILRIGLSPRSKEKLTKHPDRIYFAANINNVIGLLKSDKFKKGEDNFTIFEFDLRELKRKRKIRYFSDPIYPTKGFYTYENIPPQYLEVVKRITTKKS